MLRLSSGDDLAAEMLYEQFSNQMYALSYGITQDKMAAEDILQEAFTKSFLGIAGLREASRYGGWLKRMVVNGSIDWLKRRPQWDELDMGQHEMAQSDGEAVPAVSTEEIHRGIASLPAKCRLVFTLYLIEGHTHKVVAEMIGISISTAKSQYAYALKLLRKKIKSSVHE